jgi:hypothetical protein
MKMDVTAGVVMRAADRRIYCEASEGSAVCLILLPTNLSIRKHVRLRSSTIQDEDAITQSSMLFSRLVSAK